MVFPSCFGARTISYNIPMNEEENEELAPAEEVAEEPVEAAAEETPSKPAEEQKEARPEMPPEFVAAQASQATKTKWDSGPRPGRWSTIGCGLGIVVLIAALFVGSSLLRKTVWAGFAGTCNRIEANLPLDLPPGERMRLTRNIDRFTALIKHQDDPYEAMGEFQQLARKAIEDRVVDRDEVEEINLFLERKLAESTGGVPYSMP